MPRCRALLLAACLLALLNAPAQGRPAAKKSFHIPAYIEATFAALHPPAAPRRRSGPSTDRACLPAALKDVLATIETRYGPVRVISTHRPGARIAGTSHMSLHATCRAVDFHPPSGKYREVLAYLRASWKGGIGTYSGQHHHLHVDVGHAKHWHTHLDGWPKVATAQRRETNGHTALATNPY
jgi:hypothetical protein